MRHGGGIAAAALGVLLALTAGAPASAATCWSYRNGQCVQWCNDCAPPSARAPAPSYGAIAYGHTSKAWGASYHWASQEKAESVAVQNCAQHGNDCEAVVWFKRQCGAVASGEGTAAFWGLGDSDEQARADAQSKCVNGGGQACEVRASQCSK